MACIDSSGTLTPTGYLLLKGLDERPMPPESVAKHLGEPLFRIRGMLRELAAAELIREEGGLFELTEAGRGKL